MFRKYRGSETRLQRVQQLKTLLRLGGQFGKPDSRLLRILHRMGEGDASTLHAVGRLNPEVKAQPIQSGHPDLLRLRITVAPGEQQQCR